MEPSLLSGYLHIKCSNPGRIVRKAWRKRWLVVEFPTCDSDEVRSSSLLVRVFISHHHENKGPPAFCIPLLDVHGLHRIQSRSQPYAFSVDGNTGELVAAGTSETETQEWMRKIRSRLWEWSPLLVHRGTRVALIDNVHSDMARLRGFYGTLGIDLEDGEVVLSEARSGAEQLRWRLSNINRAFCPKTLSKRDKGRVLVIITHRTNVTGEGIFTFYSEDAKRILSKYEELCCRGSIEGEDSWRCSTSKDGSLSKTKKNSRDAENILSKKNPLSFLFKRESSFSTIDKENSFPSLDTKTLSNSRTSKQERGRRKVMEKGVGRPSRHDLEKEAAYDTREVGLGELAQDVANRAVKRTRGRTASGTSSCTRTSSCGTGTRHEHSMTRPSSSMSTRGGSSAMTLNHIGTMTSIGFEGDNYDRMSVRGDDYDQASTSMVNNLYNSSSAMAICRRNSPSPPPFLSPPTQTTGYKRSTRESLPSCSSTVGLETFAHSDHFRFHQARAHSVDAPECHETATALQNIEKSL